MTVQFDKVQSERDSAVGLRIAPTNLLYVIRHADAGDSATWPGDDSLRPLSDKGERQAGRIAKSKELASITELLSSPSLRCRQTVEPLAARLGLQIVLEDWLLTGASPLVAFDSLLEQVGALSDGQSLAACTHGDLLEGFVAGLEQIGAPFESAPIVSKGAVIVLEVSDGEVTRVAFRAAPKAHSGASR